MPFDRPEYEKPMGRLVCRRRSVIARSLIEMLIVDKILFSSWPTQNNRTPSGIICRRLAGRNYSLKVVSRHSHLTLLLLRSLNRLAFHHRDHDTSHRYFDPVGSERAFVGAYRRRGST